MTIYRGPGGTGDASTGADIFGPNSSITEMTGLTGGIETPTYIRFDPNAGHTALQGDLTWNLDEGTLDVGLNGGAVTLQVGQEQHYRVINQTGLPINNGTLVMYEGTDGNSGKLRITPWDGVSPTQTIMGITTEDIANGSNGYVTCFGKVRGIQTNGANYSETWVDGDILYAGSTGGLTKTLPQAPSSKTSVAVVVNSHVSNGALFVRVQHGSDLNQDELVQLTTLTNGDVLQYDSIDGRFENRSLTTAGIQPLDASLTSISGLTTVPDRMIYTTAPDIYDVTPITAFGRSLVDDDTASTARGTLGLGSLATLGDGDYGDIVVTSSGASWELDSNVIVDANVNTTAAIESSKLQFTTAGAVARTVQSKLRDTVNIRDFGAVGDGVTDDTAAIQAAIDAVYAAGGGVVYMPEGVYAVSATASSESWEVYGAGGVVTALAAGSCCLIMRDRVYLHGAGMNTTTILLPLNTGLKGIFQTHSPNGYGISDLTVDGQWDLTSEINSHGIFWVTTTIADEANTLFSDGEIRNVKVRRVSSYGFGLQNGVFRGNLFDNIRTELTGADGLDAKNRHGNKGNRIINATISAFGLRTSLVAQAGIDLRGEGWAVIAPRVINFGRADTPHAGVRFTPGAGTNGTQAEKSFVSDFVIEATNSNTYGVESYANGCTIGPGSIVNCVVGVWNKDDAGGTAEDNIVTGVTVDGLGIAGNAFASEGATVLRTRWIGCTAKNISQGWRPAGTNEVIIGCAVGGAVTTPLSLLGSPVNLTVEASPTIVDDYETGTWSPTFTPSTGSFTTMTVSVIYAEYVREYKKVTCNAYLRTNNVNVTGGTGTLNISGLPFASKTGSYAVCSVSEGTGWAANPPSSGYIPPASSLINLLSTAPATGIPAATTVAALFTGVSTGKNRLILSFSYFIN